MGLKTKASKDNDTEVVAPCLILIHWPADEQRTTQYEFFYFYKRVGMMQYDARWLYDPKGIAIIE